MRPKTLEGYYLETTIVFSLGSINASDSRFDTEEEGLNAAGAHESVHFYPEQIDRDNQKDGTREKYFEVEWLPYYTEYMARKEYREKHGLEGSDWGILYESEYSKHHEVKKPNFSEKPNYDED